MARTLTKANKRRAFPNVVIRKNVTNQSSRRGTPILLMVLHSTESHNRAGNSDMESIANYFNNTSSQASSTVLVDADENSARLMPDESKPWTQAFWNPFCVSIEQIGSAGMHWTNAEVRESARWIAYWSREHGIPIRIGKVDNARGVVIRSGVVSHHMLGQRGGGHHDPGAYPWKACLRWARVYKALQIARRKK